ncbi:MAG: hypothetical protein AB1716_03550 [Planctomycetota bacterium]
MAHPSGQGFDDLRNTLHEAMRIVRRRWRLAVVGLTVVGAAAFWGSQYIPREYQATTLFERRDDPVLQNLVQSNSPYGFERLKTTMALDTVGSRALLNGAVTAGLLAPEVAAGQGALTPAERAALDGVVGRHALRVTVSLPQSTASLDTIQLQCTANDPGVARALVTALRDNYIAQTRERMYQILVRTREFFVSEVQRLQEDVARAEAGLREGCDEFPGLDLSDAAGLGTRLETLRMQRNAVYERRADLEAQITAREQFLIAAAALYAQQTEAQSPAGAPRAGADPVIDRAIDAIKTQVVELMAERRMTAEHPDVKRLLGRIAAMEELRRKLAAEAAEQPAPQDAASAAPGALSESQRAWQAQRMRVELELDTLRRQLDTVHRQWQQADERAARFAALFEKLTGQSDVLRQLREERGTAAQELTLWQGHLARLERVLTAEAGDRGTQFTLLEEPKGDGRPVKPRLTAVFVVCLGLGWAAAALAVALAELFDRSFRSIGQVARALGVPALQSIGVILTPCERRRRRVRRLIWTPALGLFALGLVLTATLAWASLARPAMYAGACEVLERARGVVGLAGMKAPQ